jgi:hypothetical protein
MGNFFCTKPMGNNSTGGPSFLFTKTTKTLSQKMTSPQELKTLSIPQ